MKDPNEEQVDGDQQVEISTGRKVGLSALLIGIGVAGTIGFNALTGLFTESKASNFDQKSIEVSDTTTASEDVLVPADTTWDADTIVSVVDEHVAQTPARHFPKYIDGRENIKLELRPGQTCVLSARIDGVLSGQVSFSPKDPLPANQLWGMTISRPDFTFLDTTKTRW